MSEQYVIVTMHHGEWIVTLPEYGPLQCWSTHGDNKAEAIAEAHCVCDDFGYDSVFVER